MKDQLLLCHGHLHKAKKPRYIHRNYYIDFENATHLDMNILSIPDICADLTDASTVEKLPCNAFDIIIPIYANYHVYGESWQDRPNQVFIDVVLKTLKIGGKVVMCPACGFFGENTNDDIYVLIKELKNKFPLNTIPECNFYVVVEAFQRTQYDQKERDIVINKLNKGFQNIELALSYMESNIPVTRKCKQRRISYNDKLDHFVTAILSASENRLGLVTNTNGLISDDYAEYSMVFTKLV